ncbi:TGF-beta-activated kinase 1 and MAP3K7-binding protein 3 isoform X1 [Triplophysa rosa]|uniref:TGF-beta-activated kinase 1 and MAP3K7-binding protein 3 n=1 Tax=Triplophysa rosa TaxID=992332 RepID=A0A9W7TKF8_TRIRA|nr:TGF-beta-activated kinase 1 and MAP3K7-binding protein 3 isoform X1 [Triplophysa rosa]XP_057212261.1 TGF-beta-activated kinase 1 and MAP3K7-binding protein 3 isoform X1 [Triplophysa rosa]KAI7798023.1 TGF-beta-activated kinase 1 and MAP3K7-binding protein 3 [Triplophysa rosa]
MAQGGPQLDYHILQDLKQRFPEIPEKVVSQCLLQNNNNLDLCCRLLAQESNRYLYEEYHSPDEIHMNRNHMLRISVGYPAPEGAKSNAAGRVLVHSSSDSHIEHPRSGYPEPLSAPATMAPSPGFNPFFMNDQGRSNIPTPPPSIQGMSPTYTPVPRYMTPITVTLSQNIPSAPQALQIPPGVYCNSGNTVYMRPSPSQSPQPTPWSTSGTPVYQQSPYATPTYQSPYSSPQHQVHQSPHGFLPISPPTLPGLSYQQPPPVSHRPFIPSKVPMKNQIEITLEGQRPRSNSPVHGPQGTIYMANSPSPSSPSRGISMTGLSGASIHQGMYIHQGVARPRPASSPQSATSAIIKIKVSPGQAQRSSGSPTVETESLLNIDQGERHGAPPPILPISALPGSICSQIKHMPRRSSSGSDDYAYTQALLLHQRARMERLLKELMQERQKLEQLKAEVNEMEFDALQRRFRRVNSTSLIPRPEDMTRIRSQNRQLQIDIDCSLKEIDLLQSRGKFDVRAMNNFYDNIQPGPVVPPIVQPAPAQRDEDFEGAQWNCESCTFLNHPALHRCEQCEMPRNT